MTPPPYPGGLDAEVAGLAADLAELRSRLDDRDAAPPASAEVRAEEPVFTAAVDWAHGFLLPTFIRPVGGQIRWCDQWSEHPEAVLRVEAMWRAWEAMRLETGTGMSVYLLHHLDPGLAALTAPTGPFARCTPDRHVPPAQDPPVPAALSFECARAPQMHRPT